MLQYTILVESTPGQFTPTGEVFTCNTEDEAQAYVVTLQSQNGRCYAASLVQS